MARLDPHSYADSEQPQVRSLDWKARVDFDRRWLEAEATLTLAAPGEGPLDLDTRDLDIESIRDGDGQTLDYRLSLPDPILGSRLRIELERPTSQIHIQYRTSPAAVALQWLEPEQTNGGTKPFLFTQGQAILTRTWIPLQDSPSVRQTWSATITALAAARAASTLAASARRYRSFSSTITASALPVVFSTLQSLRAQGVSVQMHAGTGEGMGSMKSQFKKADGSGARFALIFGGDELARGEVTFKALRDGVGAQESTSLQDLGSYVAERLAATV